MKKRMTRRSKKGVKFKPNHEYVDQAVATYLAEGGTITKLQFDEKAFQDFMQTPEAPNVVDDFLNGNY